MNTEISPRFEASALVFRQPTVAAFLTAAFHNIKCAISGHQIVFSHGVHHCRDRGAAWIWKCMKCPRQWRSDNDAWHKERGYTWEYESDLTDPLYTRTEWEIADEASAN
jgi:hypothetical protein